MPDTNTHRIVLTGGPGGGKSTAADLLRRELGEKVVVVPESATLLFSGGFPRLKDQQAKIGAQKAIYHIQENMENIKHSLYPDRLLLCDRGTVDGYAYWPTTIDDMSSELGTTLEKELSRYDAVIFFESAAVGDMSIEGGNPCRLESNMEAIELDKKLRSIWSKHPNFTHIPHQHSFLKKLNHALTTIQCIIEKLY